MGDAAEFKYRAFLSYCHQDKVWANWLHARLESFVIDNDLVGQQTPIGPVPKTLRPIFRDREDFSGGYKLTDATVAALNASAALIVLCSTVSAGRTTVNEEVRLFRSRHPDRRVVPVIIDGTWPNNFPPALRFELAADGAITDHPITILGPDLRQSADGKNLGLAKIIAGLTGLAPDDVYRRAERSRRKHERLRTAIVAAIIALVIIGGGFYWQAHQQQELLAEITALVDKYNRASPDQTGVGHSGRENLKEAITKIAEGAATDPRYAEALEYLKAGKPGEAEPLLRAVAEEKAKRADKDAKDAAAAYRNLASIVAVSDPGRAREYFAQAAHLDPLDIEGMMQNGWFQEQAGELDAAQAAYAHVIAAARSDNNSAIVWATLGMGDIQKDRGDLGAALASYQAALAIADRFTKSDPRDTGRQGDLAMTYTRIGHVQSDLGNLPAALASYQMSLAIVDRLAKSDPHSLGWQRELAISYENLGDVQVAQGNLSAALSSYQTCLAISDRLSKSDPRNAFRQYDLGLINGRVGDVHKATGNLPAALVSYQVSQTILDRLAKSDPRNTGWQHDLSVTYGKIGVVQAAQGNLSAALASYRFSQPIADRLANSDPGNAELQRNLLASYLSIGDVQVEQGNLPDGLVSYNAACNY
jgi:tetratricopeptide (TPR) repeat protein